jgi:hypothetical protein
MRLVELDPHFLVRKPTNDADMRHVLERTSELAVADGIRFLCPKCYTDNGGPEGTHSILIPFAGKALNDRGWQVSGTSFSDLTLRPSIAIYTEKGGCGFHGFITNGEVISV